MRLIKLSQIQTTTPKIKKLECDNPCTGVHLLDYFLPIGRASLTKSNFGDSSILTVEMEVKNHPKWIYLIDFVDDGDGWKYHHISLFKPSGFISDYSTDFLDPDLLEEVKKQISTIPQIEEDPESWSSDFSLAWKS